MAKSNFAEMQARVRKASTSSAPSLDQRMKHAQAVVDRQPTGFPEEQSAEDELRGPAFTRESDREAQGRVRLEEVAMELIDSNPFNARRIYVPERVKELASSIASTGQLIPGIATIREGRYILVAGHYRAKAVKVAGLPTMKLMVHLGLSDQDLYKISYKENDERSGQSPLDNALSWRDLIDKGIFANESAIAEVTGQSLSNINKTLSILRLSDQVMDIVKGAPLNFALTSLYELVLFEQAAGQKPALEIAEKIAAGDAGRKEVAELRARLEAPKERKRKENSRQYRINVDGEQLGFIKEWDSGKVAFEVQLNDPKERQLLLEELKRRFNLGDPH